MTIKENIIKNWYAIVVKPKHEFKVFEKLQSIGVEALFPTVERLRKWKDRKKLVIFPLFPNYLFVRIIPAYENILSVLKVKSVARFLGTIPGKPEAIPDIQIDSLQKLLENKEDIDLYPSLKVGEKVIIKKGPLAGVEGVLVKKSSNEHIMVVSIDLLDQAVAWKLDATDLGLF